MKEYDRELQPEIQAVMRQVDLLNQALDQREAIIARVTAEIESFGGRIVGVTWKKVEAEFDEFPEELCMRIVEEKRTNWDLDYTALRVRVE